MLQFSNIGISFAEINLSAKKINLNQKGGKMAEIIKETETTTPVKRKATSYQTIEYLVYFIFGALEILLIFRLILKLMGASAGNTFVNLIYGLTGIFIMPFEGIFRLWFAQVTQTTSVFEPSTLVAIIVYAVLAVGIVKLVRILSRQQQAN